MMGREVRKVPPNWDHPKVERPYGMGYQPMYDQTFADAVREWKDAFVEWEAGKRPNYCSGESALLEYWEWAGNPPEREYYRPWGDDEATWFQVWETVSEGTPVTPPFPTKDELINYLATHGDFWDQKRGDGAWSFDVAKRFVEAGWAPSMIVTTARGGASAVCMPRDGAF